jgi:adenosylcobinamide-GDP ribazoletransferase
MEREKTDILAVVDLPAALGLLTRLPIPVDGEAAIARGARAAWAWPVAGLLVGAISGIVGWAALAAGLPAGIAVILALACQVALTGAMHEDGLADSLDGLWGGWTRERRLEIMKDSHIGVYGVTGLILAFALRWQILVHLIAEGLSPVAALVALGAASRASMVVLTRALPHARDAGLSATVGRPGTATTLLAVILGLGIGLLALGWNAIPLALAMALAGALWARVAMRRIGGQTGDILGAGQMLTELSGGLVLLIVLG